MNDCSSDMVSYYLHVPCIIMGKWNIKTVLGSDKVKHTEDNGENI